LYLIKFLLIPDWQKYFNYSIEKEKRKKLNILRFSFLIIF